MGKLLYDFRTVESLRVTQSSDRPFPAEVFRYEAVVVSDYYLSGVFKIPGVSVLLLAN